MRLVHRLMDALDIHAGECRLVGLLLLFSFCNGLVRTFTRSAAYALFLAVFSAQMLPYIYIGVSLVASLASVAYLQLAQRVALARLLIGTLAALVLVFARCGSTKSRSTSRSAPRRLQPHLPAPPPHPTRVDPPLRRVRTGSSGTHIDTNRVQERLGRRYPMAWHIDASHSEIQFSARHMMISTVRGRFNKFSGTIEADEQNPTAAHVYVEIDAASLDTGDEKRDAHLRSPDFLNVEQYPTLIFRSTKVERLDEEHGRLHGDLTVRDQTRPVVLDVEYAGMAKSPWGTTSAGFSAQTRLNRKDWGLNWNVALETGGWLVSDELRISIEVELVKQAQQAEAEGEAEAESLHNERTA